MAEASIGLQIGAQGSKIIYLIMTDRGMAKMVDGKAKLGADMNVAVGPMGGEVFTLYIGNDWQNQGIGGRLMVGLFQDLVRRNMGDAVIWVLSGNPARYFYEAMGGTRVAEGKERFAGVLLDETAYGWPDLRTWLSERGWRP